MNSGLFILYGALITHTYVESAGPRNLTESKPRSLVTNELEEDWSRDPYVNEADLQCVAGEVSGCIRSKAAGFVGSLFRRHEFLISEEARFVKMAKVSSKPVKMEGFDFSETPRSGETTWSSAIGFLMRRAEEFLKTTALEVDLTPELTENGRYQPRFIDEIYSEVDTLDDKSDKPNSK
ncbi:Protein of unknown function (DUF1676) [Nesidiocoris tenuis]|uniref:Uncharacterized protein n=1 Tax=Nesidiocoris tenuis TaxID=355587 RepID=A0ABN7AV95_9HEMI|nr:Protein of unknown function (DUF1676) [Nesidiocoris tenuis]